MEGFQALCGRRGRIALPISATLVSFRFSWNVPTLEKTNTLTIETMH